MCPVYSWLSNWIALNSPNERLGAPDKGCCPGTDHRIEWIVIEFHASPGRMRGCRGVPVFCQIDPLERV